MKSKTRSLAMSPGATRPLSFCFLQELLEVPFPDDGLGMRSMADGFIARGNEDCLALRHTFDFPFEDVQLRRIDQIVGEVDSQEAGADLLESRPGIIIPRTLDGVKRVVRVHRLES